MRKRWKAIAFCITTTVCICLLFLSSPFAHRSIWHPILDSICTQLAVINTPDRSATVVCANRDIKAGEIIKEDSVRVENRRYANFPSSSPWFYFTDEVVGSTARTNIPAGQIVTAKELEDTNLD